MAANAKRSDISNWYSGGSGYAMQPRQEAVKAPRPSQIPGLSDANDDSNVGSSSTPNRQFIRDTDSAYVKLAKQGGRSDLLYDAPTLDQDNGQNFRTKRPLAVHKRADWYYQDDPQQGAAQQASSTSGGHGSGQNYNGIGMDRQGGGYNQQPLDESYGDGMFNSGYSAPDPNDYSQKADYGYGRDYSSSVTEYHTDDMKNPSYLDYGMRGTPSDYNQRMAAGYEMDQGQLTSDFDQRMNFDGRANERISSGVPASSYEQRQTSAQSRRQDTVGDRQQTPYGTSAVRRDSAVRQSPFATDRNNSAYSSVSRSDYGIHQASDASNSNNSNKMKPSASGSLLDEASHRHVNRMKRENATQSEMSKLMSFGYLDDKSRQLTPDRRAASRDDLAANSMSRMSSATSGVQSRLSRAASQDRVWPSPSATPTTYDSAVRRKPVEDNRPDFFRLGNNADPVTAKPPQFGRRKASFDSKPDSFSNGSTGEPGSGVSGGGNRPTFGRTKREEEEKPDFFTIGSRNQPNSSNNQQPAYNDDVTDDMLEKVAGYRSSASQGNNFRRKKMDSDIGMRLTSPVRSTAK